MGEPLVSVIIPNFNYDKYIVDCLLSCVNQNYKNVEIIVIDDASTDKSCEMIQKVKDGRIIARVLEYNSGYSYAKNYGIGLSKGKYIITLDGDDMVTPVSVEKRIKYLEENPDCEIVHGISYKFDGDRSYAWCLRKQYKLPFDRKPAIHAQGVAMPRTTYEKYGLYYERLRSKADSEYWQRLRIAGAKFGKIMTKCAYYRSHLKSMLHMRRRQPKYEKKIVKIYDERIAELKRDGITKNNTRFM